MPFLSLYSGRDCLAWLHLEIRRKKTEGKANWIRSHDPQNQRPFLSHVSPHCTILFQLLRPVQLPDRPVDLLRRVVFEGVQAHLLWNHLLTYGMIKKGSYLAQKYSQEFIISKIKSLCFYLIFFFFWCSGCASSSSNFCGWGRLRQSRLAEPPLPYIFGSGVKKNST